MTGGGSHSIWASTGLMGLIDQPQMVRLLRIRNTDFPSTESLAEFAEKALASKVPHEEIRDCLWEYFAREDVFEEMNELDADGYAQFSKTRGGELLWKLAGTAPVRIAVAIANKAPFKGKLWKVSQEALTALPDEIKRSVVRRGDGQSFTSKIYFRRLICSARLTVEFPGRLLGSMPAATAAIWEKEYNAQALSMRGPDLGFEVADNASIAYARIAQ